MKKYKAVISGLGKIAWRFVELENDATGPLTHASTIAAIPEIDLVAGYSPCERDRRDFNSFSDLPTYDDFDKMLVKEQPDIVSICSPDEIHYVQLLKCIDRGVPMIWLEKPPVDDLNQFDSLMETMAATKASTKILVNYQRRYSHHYNKLKDIYTNQTLGDCVHISVNYSRGLVTNGSHMIDMLFYVLGDETTYNIDWVDNHSKQNPVFFLTMSNGISVHFNGMDLPYHCIDFSMVFEKGRLSVNHGGIDPVWEYSDEHEFFSGFYRLKNGKNEEFFGEEMIGDSFKNALRDLINSHENSILPLSNLWSSYKTMDLIKKVQDFGTE